MKAIRHGDLCLVLINQLPNNLVETETTTIMEGKSNSHEVTNGKVYFKDVSTFVFGYLVAEKGCKLLHPDHGVGSGVKTAEIPVGIYELRRQFEQTHDSMKQVVD